MSDASTIEWTEATWNPVRGCNKVSPGCKHCYAETFAERFRGVPGHPYEQGFDLRLVESSLDLPRKWKRGRHIFVNSMSDLFHSDVPTDYIARVFDVMRETQQHTYQVLTKRSARMAELLAETITVPHNVWIGVSVEDAHYASRINDLVRAKARTRFLSVEPLLGPLSTLPLAGVHWVIVGGESGAGARPMDPSWVRDIRDQCVAARVPFFFKQWGGFNKKKAGRVLDGRTWDEMPFGNAPWVGRELRVITEAPAVKFSAAPKTEPTVKLTKVRAKSARTTIVKPIYTPRARGAGDA